MNKQARARERIGPITEVESCELAQRCAELLRDAATIAAGLESLSTGGAFTFAGGMVVDAAVGNAERLERIVSEAVKRRRLGGAS